MGTSLSLTPEGPSSIGTSHYEEIGTDVPVDTLRLLRYSEAEVAGGVPLQVVGTSENDDVLACLRNARTAPPTQDSPGHSELGRDRGNRCAASQVPGGPALGEGRVSSCSHELAAFPPPKALYRSPWSRRGRKTWWT